MPEQTHVIVGAGLAGAKAAETLRTEGFGGRVILIGDEPHRPYERPPLSKGLLKGTDPDEHAFVHDAGFYDSHAIELRTGQRVTGLDIGLQQVTVGEREIVRYDRLLLATGAAPRRLDVPGAELPGVHYLRTLDDARNLRDAFSRAGRAIVVGAGWIGTEVAAAARSHGLRVTIVDPAPLPLAATLGTEVGAVYRDLHAANGVELHLRTHVAEILGSTHARGIRTTAGAILTADIIVVGIGAQPRTALAADAGLTVGGGIEVSPTLEASANGVFAAGDAAAAWHPWLRRRLRVEHWANALNQGATAARNMLGAHEPYERVPYFFSDQYDLGMEFSGDARGHDQVVFRGDPGEGRFVAFWLRDGIVIAAMNANVWDVVDPLQAIIRSRQPVEPARLRDPDTPLEALVPAHHDPPSSRTPDPSTT